MLFLEFEPRLLNEGVDVRLVISTEKANPIKPATFYNPSNHGAKSLPGHFLM